MPNTGPTKETELRLAKGAEKIGPNPYKGGVLNWLVDILTGGIASEEPGPLDVMLNAPAKLAGLPFAAYKALGKLPKSKVFHGTQRAFDTFDSTKADQSDVLGWMTHFAEDPKYAKEYMMGQTKGVKNVNVESFDEETFKTGFWDNPPNARINPRMIPAEPQAKNVLDLVDPNSDDISAALANVDPQQRANLIYSFKTARRNLREQRPEDFYTEQYIKSSHLPKAPERIDPKEVPVRAVAENLRLTPEQFKATPFDAIRYHDVGNKSWAVPHGTEIKTPWGTPLTEEVKPLRVIKSDRTGGGKLIPSFSKYNPESNLTNKFEVFDPKTGETIKYYNTLDEVLDFLKETDLSGGKFLDYHPPKGTK